MHRMKREKRDRKGKYMSKKNIVLVGAEGRERIRKEEKRSA